MKFRRKDDNSGPGEAESRGGDPGAGEDASDTDATTGAGSRVETWNGSLTLSPTVWYQPSARPHLEFRDPKPLEIRQRQEVRVGWKLAHLVVWNGVHFGSLRDATKTYEGDATASCSQSGGYYRFGSVTLAASVFDQPYAIEKHDAPGEHCTCGFYAVNDPDHLTEQDGTWPLLEVELYGRVIVCEKGYRAQRQRVRRCVVPSSCVYCGDEAVGLGVFGFVPRQDPGNLHPVCRSHEFSHATFSLDDLATKLDTVFEWAQQ